jgi:hypothetical protein
MEAAVRPDTFVPDASVHDAELVGQAIGLRQRQAEAALERLRAADRRLEIGLTAEARRTTAAAVASDMIAQGKRALMVGAAAALVILAAGVAVRVAQPPKVTPAGPPPLAVTGSAAPAPPPPTAVPADHEDIIVSNYVLFRERRTTVAGTDYLVQTGHQFADERAATFNRAWCYTAGFMDGVHIRLELGELAPGGAPVPLENAGSRAALGLTEADAAELFAACPWLSGGAG